jgi:hypothetical protein
MFDTFKDQLTKKAKEAERWLTLVEPVPPHNDKGMLTALITAAGLISITLLAGVGLCAMTILLLALGLVLLILSRVFGVEFDMDPQDFMRF